jgi:hypothetical protein
VSKRERPVGRLLTVAGEVSDLARLFQGRSYPFTILAVPRCP